ncbi:MAG: hypothetical protein R3F62_05230 [Planctomycetota bacterium]
MTDRSAWPGWVSMGLIGVHSSAVAWAFVVLCLAGALGGCAYASQSGDVRGWLSLLLVPAAGWYVAAIQWVESHSDWD